MQRKTDPKANLELLFVISSKIMLSTRRMKGKCFKKVERHVQGWPPLLLKTCTHTHTQRDENYVIEMIKCTA